MNRLPALRLISGIPITLFSALMLVLMAQSQTTAQPPEVAKKSYKLVFSGNEGEDYVVIPKLRYDGSHPITLEAVVTSFARASEPIRSCVIGNVEISGVGISCKPLDWRFNVNDGRAFDLGYAYAHSDKKPEPDKQVHIAGVFDGKNLTMFVDGKLQSRTGMTMAPHNASDFDFMIGADPDGDGNPQHFFKGTIDEVRISKVARYKADFPPLKEKFKTDADTLVLYHFDEGSGEVAKDASGNKHDGQIHGTKWVQAPE